jgi:hypothetical protein
MPLPWKRRHVRITEEQVQVRAGLRRYVVRREDVLAVFTTMMPKDDDFQEVVAVEFLGEEEGGILVLDPAWGFSVEEALDALRALLGERWDDRYLGHKHLSRVRGLESPE